MKPRKLTTSIGWVEKDRVFWTDKVDGGPFRMLALPNPRMPEAREIVSGEPFFGKRRPEGVAFALALRVNDGGLVSLDVTHGAWVLASQERVR